MRVLIYPRTTLAVRGTDETAESAPEAGRHLSHLLSSSDFPRALPWQLASHKRAIGKLNTRQRDRIEKNVLEARHPPQIVGTIVLPVRVDVIDDILR